MMICYPYPTTSWPGMIVNWFAAKLLRDRVEDSADKVGNSIDTARMWIVAAIAAVALAIFTLCTALFFRGNSHEDSDALFTLGNIYMTGKVDKSADMAVQMYRLSAKSGNKDAQFSLAECYASGNAIVKDTKKAYKWYKKAAKGGNTQAQFSLAECYENGTGTKENAKKALHWYKKASKSGNPEAKNKAEQMKSKIAQAKNAKNRWGGE